MVFRFLSIQLSSVSYKYLNAFLNDGYVYCSFWLNLRLMWALHWTFLSMCWLISIYLYALHIKMLARAMYMLLISAGSYNPSYIHFFLAASMLSLLLLRDSLLWIGRGWCTKLSGKSSRALCMLLTRWPPELHLKQPKTNRMQQRCDRLLRFFLWERPFWCIAFNFYIVTPT